VLELYIKNGESKTHTAFIEFARKRKGIAAVVRNVDASEKDRTRLVAIARYHGLRNAEALTPLVYGLNRVLVGFKSPKDFARQLRELLQMEVFVRAGCSRCAMAHDFLDSYSRRYPGLEVVYREVTRDAAALSELNRLVAKHNTRAVSVPVFHLCDKLLVGFAGPDTTGRRLDGLLLRWTTPCNHLTNRQSYDSQHETRPPPISTTARIGSVSLVPVLGMLSSADEPSEGRHFEQAESALDDLELPLPTAQDSVDGEVPPGPAQPDTESSDADSSDVTTVELPVFGKLSVRGVGLPLLTLAMGLVDGFNPCAMWVLLLLLSVLVNLQDRRRILAVAGTFVFVSGFAYLAFMAAWLNVFAFVGYLRPVQIALGLVAIVIGSVHIKDFFALHRGVSLSIPESAKPSIYAQTRRIVTAENLWGALIAATALAVGVNVVELLCTAGLPAIFTEILTQQDVPAWQECAYLILYIAAYIFDDALMVAAVVITLHKRKLQEQQGRWLKLISGVAIFALGLIMLVRPDWMF
jgi:hypothetical protein